MVADVLCVIAGLQGETQSITNMPFIMPFNMSFTMQAVTAAIKRLKNNKSAGIDGILNKFLKHCPNDICI